MLVERGEKSRARKEGGGDGMEKERRGKGRGKLDLNKFDLRLLMSLTGNNVRHKGHAKKTQPGNHEAYHHLQKLC